MEKLALTPAEAGEAIGISRAKAYELIRAGEIPSFKVGSSTRISVAALQRWIAEQESGDVQPLAVVSHNAATANSRERR